jgi:hypothetical protein
VLADIRTALATALGTVTGLRSSATVPDNPRPPIAVIIPDRIDFDLNARRGADRFMFTVTVIVGRADDRTAQNRLDGFIVGENSVKRAIEADRTLGGKVDTCRVTEMRNYSSLTIGEVVYLSAEFVVEVVA